MGIPNDNLVLMAAGGGQGSQHINELMLSIAPDLLKTLPNLSIIHFTGIGMADQYTLAQISDSYKARLSQDEYKRIVTVDFTSDFYKYSGAADLIITRAGATALAEFALQHKACITIPNPHLTNGHQIKNAEGLKRLGAAVVLSDDLQPEKLLQITIELLKDDKKRQNLADKLEQLAKPQAAQDLANIILSAAEKRK